MNWELAVFKTMVNKALLSLQDKVSVQQERLTLLQDLSCYLINLAEIRK